MPTYTTVYLDRVIQARDIPNSKLKGKRYLTRNSSQVTETVASASKVNREGSNIPSHPKLDNTNNGSSSSTATSTMDRKHHWTQILPALYATPEPTPLPDSPSSFPPSPYVINHKRRGPRLVKSLSEDDVAIWKQAESLNSGTVKVASGSNGDAFVPMKVPDLGMEYYANEKQPKGSLPDVEHCHEGLNGAVKPFSAFGNFGLPPEDTDADDFVDTRESMSVKSTSESEGTGGVERSLNLAEFYDAWEELSSENGSQLQKPDLETELRELRSTLLMEIEKREQAEEALCNIQNQWKKIGEKLSLVGLTLPVDPTTQPEELCRQVYIARFVSNSIGRGIAKAEVEMELEAQMKVKNSECARLLDRLHYYEAVNQEMSHRNQEVVDTARRLRQRRKRTQKWVWGSIAAAVALGSAILAYTYIDTGKTSSTQSSSQVSEPRPR